MKTKVNFLPLVLCPFFVCCADEKSSRYYQSFNDDDYKGHYGTEDYESESYYGGLQPVPYGSNYSGRGNYYLGQDYAKGQYSEDYSFDPASDDAINRKSFIKAGHDNYWWYY